MSFRDRLRRVRLLDRLRPWFTLIAVVPALIVVDQLEPIGWMGGYFLILYGIGIGDIDRRLNPPPEPQKGPWLPWNQMGVGDKLEYFFVELFLVPMALLVIIVTVLGSDRPLEEWPILTASLFMAGVGIWHAYSKWLNRWGAVESE